jgi:hypothetical protein
VDVKQDQVRPLRPHELICPGTLLADQDLVPLGFLEQVPHEVEEGRVVVD